MGYESRMQPKRSVTMRDIARHLNVAPCTVSRALTGKPGVSEATRRYIRTVAKAMGYEGPKQRFERPTMNFPALGAKPYPSRIRVLLLNTHVHNKHWDWESRLLSGIIAHSKQERYEVSVDICHEMDVPTTAETWLPETCDGLIIIGARADQQFPSALRNVSSRVVLIERHMWTVNFSSVLADDAHGGYLATKHLLELGHKHIALVTRPRGYSESLIKREDGYRKALAEAGIPVDDSLITFADGWDPHHGERAVERLIEAEVPFTAIFGCTDRFAIGALRAIKKAGGRVPEDVSVVGFDDIEMASYVDPPLTTVRLPMMELGYEAARMLTRLLREQISRPRQVVIDVDLVQRESTAPAPRFPVKLHKNPAQKK